MRCLVVSFHFPPDPAIGAVRVAGIVDALMRAGHEVRVVSAAQPVPACQTPIGFGDVRRPTWFDVSTLRFIRTRPATRAPNAERSHSVSPPR